MVYGQTNQDVSASVWLKLCKCDTHKQRWSSYRIISATILTVLTISVDTLQVELGQTPTWNIVSFLKHCNKMEQDKPLPWLAEGSSFQSAFWAHCYRLAVRLGIFRIGWIWRVFSGLLWMNEKTARNHGCCSWAMTPGKDVMLQFQSQFHIFPEEPWEIGTWMPSLSPCSIVCNCPSVPQALVWQETNSAYSLVAILRVSDSTVWIALAEGWEASGWQTPRGSQWN